MKLLQYGKGAEGLYEIEFLIEPDQFELAVAKTFRQSAGKITVPGFRRGEAPRSVIEKMYGEDIFYQEAIDEIFPIVYDEAIHITNIHPVGQPEVEVKEISREKGATLYLKVPVAPEVELGEYKGLKAEKTVNPVEEARIDSQLLGLQNRNARMVEKEGAAADGDFVTIDFEGFVDGKAFDGGKSEGYPLQLGSGQFIPGFEEQIVGHSAGETFELEVTFPEDYQAAELAGKPAVFKVNLTQVQAKEMPDLDDEFAKDVSEFDTMEELRADLRAKATTEDEKAAEEAVENDLMEQVVSAMKADVPNILYERKIDDLITSFAYRLEGQGLKLDTYLKYTNATADEFRATFRAQAEQQVKMRLALDKIVELEKIEVTEDEITAQVQKMAEQFGMTEEDIRKAVPDGEIKGDLAANKAVDFVRAAAVVTDKAPEAEKAEKPAAKKAKKAVGDEAPAKKPAAKKAKKTEEAPAEEAEAPAKKPAKKPAAKKTKKAEDEK